MFGRCQNRALRLHNTGLKQPRRCAERRFQWRNLNGCKLPGKPLYLFVPLVWLSMSLISWEEAVRGGVALPAHTLESAPLLLEPHTQTHKPSAPSSVHRCESWGSPFPLLPYGLSSTLQLLPIDTLLAAKGSVREIRQTLGMAVTTKQWINTDMHLFIYIKNGPVLHQHSALSSARTYIHTGFKGTFWKIAALSAGQGEGRPVIDGGRIKTCSGGKGGQPFYLSTRKKVH